MAIKNPLVLYPDGNPQIQELKAGDTLAGAAPGPSGDDGAAATVSVGTVTTVDPGDPATVTNSGTTSAAVFDFEIPKGEAGTNGSNGTNGTGSGANFICNGRLTLTSGTPVPTSDVTGATTIYFTPYYGNQVSLYTSSVWTGYTFSERSLALGTLTSDKNYDVFLYDNSGTLTLELSSAWTNDTTRADALALQDGVYVKSSDHSRRYLGTFRTTSTTATEDSAGGVSTNVGGKRFVWNAYNRVARHIGVISTDAQYTYTTNTWRQANAKTGNKVEFVNGLGEDSAQATLSAVIDAVSNVGRGPQIAIGLDSTSSPTGSPAGWYNATSSGHEFFVTSIYAGFPGIGYHYLAWLEKGGDGTGQKFAGQNVTGTSNMRAMIFG